MLSVASSVAMMTSALFLGKEELGWRGSLQKLPVWFGMNSRSGPQPKMLLCCCGNFAPPCLPVPGQKTCRQARNEHHKQMLKPGCLCPLKRWKGLSKIERPVLWFSVTGTLCMLVTEESSFFSHLYLSGTGGCLHRSANGRGELGLSLLRSQSNNYSWVSSSWGLGELNRVLFTPLNVNKTFLMPHKL